MADEIEMTVAPSAVERAMELFESFRQRDHAELVQARKAVTEHVFGRVAAGGRAEVVVSGLAHLKSLERMREETKP